MIERIRIFSICIVMLFAAATVAWTKDGTVDLTSLSIEELMNIPVYGASKFEQKLSEAPSSVTIITADEIKKYGYRTLADILRSLRGFYVTYDRGSTYLGVRGFGRTGDWNSRILILVDGHKLNENIYDSVPIGNEMIIDIDLIDRIEVIRGPSYTLYGNNAFFAVINIITRSGSDYGSLEVSGEAGSLETYKARTTYGNFFRNGLELMFSGSLFDSKGNRRLFYKEFDDPATNNGIAENGDFGRNHSLFAKLSFKDFTLEGAHVSRTKGIPTSAYGSDFNDPRNRTIDERGYIDLKYGHDFGNRLNLTARLFYDLYRFEGTFVHKEVLHREFAEGKWWGGEATVAKGFGETHRVIAGAEYQVNEKQNQYGYDEDPFYSYYDVKKRSKRWAFYIQDEVRLLKDLILNAGIRYDHLSTFGGTTNPRIALIYNPFEKTSFKLLYGTAFRTPNNFELYFEAAPFIKSNPDLKSETIHTYNLIYEQYIGDKVFLTAGGFYYRIKDLISQVVDPVDGMLVYKNTDEIEAKGLEFEIEGRWEDGIRGRFSYTFSDARDSKTGNWPVNSPKHLAKANLILPLLRDKLFGGLEVQYMSKRKTLAGNTTDGFFVTNLTLFSRNLMKGLEVSGSIYNLFDKKYGDPGGSEHKQDIIEQDGRTFRVKVTHAW